MLPAMRSSILALSILVCSAGAAGATEVDGWRSSMPVQETKACLVGEYVAHRRGDVPMTTDVGDKVMLSWPSVYAIFFIRPDEAGHGSVISHNRTPFASLMFKRLKLENCGIERVGRS